MWVCPECFHEWTESNKKDEDIALAPEAFVVKDAFGQILQEGDSITVIKELKLKGSSSVVKVGTKAKNIRLAELGDGHDISCKIDGFGTIYLKSEFVKKA